MNLLSSLILISISFVSLNGQSDIFNYNKTEYKAYYAALLIEKFRPDTVWHDGISCSMPEDLDIRASREIDSLVSVSIENLWYQSDERSDFKGDRETWVLDPLCVALELLAVLNSNDLDVLARAYGKRGTPKREKLEAGYETFKLGAMIQEARHEKGMTQEELAEKCGTTKSYISKLENDVKEVRISTLQKIVHDGLDGELQLNIKLRQRSK